MYVHEPHACSACVAQKKLLNPLELECYPLEQMAVNCHVGAGNRTWVDSTPILIPTLAT